nr:hypothetical protein [Pedobacter psychrodurus]
MIPNGQKRTCIIVDDNPITRESLIMLVQQIDDLKVVNDCENTLPKINLSGFIDRISYHFSISITYKRVEWLSMGISCQLPLVIGKTYIG